MDAIEILMKLDKKVLVMLCIKLLTTYNRWNMNDLLKELKQLGEE